MDQTRDEVNGRVSRTFFAFGQQKNRGRGLLIFFSFILVDRPHVKQTLGANDTDK